ncbi:hypothetical protein E2R68_02150 [Psychromonas sp. RZ22]|uniref:hypothetical protein n=1 Tax=Psychromonas algarum TaxID=2555643 RepID=UPI00106737E8|nr:hypothetical protein [Psychromonas sp. RZ22]TEW56854.1 hypothetical protein E2R68_02150 [Psychromonas sp. RZ22]
MKLTKIAAATKFTAVALSAALMFGCGGSSSSSSSTPSDPAPDVDVDPDAPVLLQSLLISDTSTENSYARYNLPTPQAAGKVSANVLLNANEEKLSYITINSEISDSNNDAVVDLKMGTKAGSDYPNTTEGYTSLHIRQSGDDIDTGIEIADATWATIDIEWDVTTTDLTITVTNLADGSEIGKYEGNVTNASNATKVRFKTADQAGVSSTATPYYVDDIVISDAAGEVVYENNFTSSSLSAFTISGTGIEVTDAENAIVPEGNDGGTDDNTDEGGEIGDGTYDPANSTKVAAVEDTLTNDTGELRYSFDNAIAEGSVVASFLYDANETESAYLTVFSDAGTSTSKSQHLADLKFDEGKLSLRNQEGTLATFTPGEWVDIKLDWVTNGTTAADITLTVNGDEIGTYTNTYAPGDDNLGAKDVQVRYMGSSAVTDYTLYLDELSVLDQTTEVFFDDFEGFAAGTELGTENDSYHGNSSEATVADQPVL